MNRSAINTTEQESAEYKVESLGHVPRSGTAGSDGGFIYRFLRVHTVSKTAVPVCIPT